MQRRELFTGFKRRINGEKKSIKPPYLKGSLEVCIECEAPCIEVCETNILQKNKQGHLEVVFNLQGCTYCDECANICDKEVLDIGVEHPHISSTIFIDESLCVSYHGVMCMSCKDPCNDDAIQFENLFKPVINDKCTSCGFCIAKCPTQAIKVLH